MRALPGDRVEVATRDGGRKVVRANTLVMVRRPNGDAPTANQRAVLAEDKRRAKDPTRGNGIAADDHGDGSPVHEEPTAQDQLTPTRIEHMSTEELEKLWGTGYSTEYDRDTMEAIAKALDERAPLTPQVQHAADVADTADERSHAFDAAWPPSWTNWARAHGPMPTPTRRSEAEEAFYDYAENRFAAAEDFTRGQLFKPLYRERPDLLPDSIFGDQLARAFFYGNKATTDDAVRNKYASDELKRWFKDNGYGMSLDEWLNAYNDWNLKTPDRSGFRSEHG